MPKFLYPGTLDKLDYMIIKLENMVHDMEMAPSVNVNEIDRLEADIKDLHEFVYGGRQPQTPEDWLTIKAYCGMADMMRASRAIHRSLLNAE